jgi:hypothetical protein
MFVLGVAGPGLSAKQSTRPLIVKFRPAVKLGWSFFTFPFKMEGAPKPLRLSDRTSHVESRTCSMSAIEIRNVAFSLRERGFTNSLADGLSVCL